MSKSFGWAGPPFTVSSDAPIGPIEPFEHIFAAVNRTNHEGQPGGGWMPDKKLDIDESYRRHISATRILNLWRGRKEY